MSVGMGVHVFVFVDDFLIAADTEAAAHEANRIILELLAELGLPYAPHKARGPARVIEFFVSHRSWHWCCVLDGAA